MNLEDKASRKNYVIQAMSPVIISGGCCLWLSEQYFSYINGEKQVTLLWDDDDVCFVLDEHI